ncbi:4451_t:CDS:1 [Acaulospora colombiana]|uniref:4451_t:CDS:1 n=1 Tax=Acaulospora colombiana TaxID=27376 RepID=A0ACA9LG67_9GLOM|nr:4451_t:CDS:1 [Acaulospora colombiana]
MYSQQHDDVSPTRHQQAGAPMRTGYHSPGRGEYSPPLSDGYYTAPPFQQSHMHLYHPPPRHYVPYPNIPPQIPLPNEYSEQSHKQTSKPDIIGVSNSSNIHENNKNKSSNSVKNSTPPALNSKAKFKKERFGFFDTQTIEDDKRYA